MDEPKWKFGLMENPAFLKYLNNLPTHRRRILAVSDEKSGADKYVVSDQVGEQPPVVCADSDEEE